MKVAAGSFRVAAAIAATLAFAALPVIVLAHAELISSDPPAGGTLTTTPYTLTATFDDELTRDGSSIVVENAAGTQVATGSVSDADEFTLTAELPVLPDGTYTVRWTAVSADDGAVERGTYTFNVEGGAASEVPFPTPSPGSVSGDTIWPDGTFETLVALVLAGIAIVVIVVFVRRRS